MLLEFPPSSSLLASLTPHTWVFISCYPPSISPSLLLFDPPIKPSLASASLFSPSPPSHRSAALPCASRSAGRSVDSLLVEVDDCGDAGGQTTSIEARRLGRLRSPVLPQAVRRLGRRRDLERRLGEETWRADLERGLRATRKGGAIRVLLSPVGSSETKLGRQCATNLKRRGPAPAGSEKAPAGVGL